MSRKRRRSGSDDAVIVVLLGLLVLGALVAVIRWVIAQAVHYWYLTVLAAAVAIAVGVVAAVGAQRERRLRQERLARLRYTLPGLDTLNPTDFEFACRDLLRRDGFFAEQRGGARDRAVDVIGHAPDGRTVVLQCKHTTVGSRIGSPVLYELNGTARDIHKAQVAVVVTNGGFTSDARTVATQLSLIHLIDRVGLERWAARGESLYDVLGLPAQHRGNSSQR